MNAYELADELDKVQYQNGSKPFEMYATMLRHQADYIKHLEEGLDSSINLNKAQAERQEKWYLTAN